MSDQVLEDRTLQIAIVSETAAQACLLQQLVLERGYQVHSSTLLDNLSQLQASADMDAWLVNVGGTEPRSRSLESWLIELDQPMIISDLQEQGLGTDEVQLWKSRMAEKLHRLEGSINLESHPQGAAPFVWVLGASTGGPEAVKSFMQALPADLGVGFIYVQHIDPGYEQTLVDMLNKHSHYPACPVTHGAVLPVNATAVVAGDRRVELLDNGTLALHEGEWPGAYSPSIDQVFADVASSYGSQCGAIVFTGMADDGTAGARLIHQNGGQVWVQSPSSCTISSMPDEALNTGVVSVIASPEGLAARLVEFMQNEAGEPL